LRRPAVGRVIDRYWAYPRCKAHETQGALMGDDGDLRRWQDAPRIYISDSANPLSRALLQAARSRSAVSVIYYGGSTPGARRLVRPHGIFRLPGSDSFYVEAYCELRGAKRTFRLELLHGLSEPPERRATREPRVAKTGCAVTIAWILTCALVFICLAVYSAP
jgi:hypothetical protein